MMHVRGKFSPSFLQKSSQTVHFQPFCVSCADTFFSREPRSKLSFRTLSVELGIKNQTGRGWQWKNITHPEKGWKTKKKNLLWESKGTFWVCRLMRTEASLSVKFRDAQSFLWPSALFTVLFNSGLRPFSRFAGRERQKRGDRGTYHRLE